MRNLTLFCLSFSGLTRDEVLHRSDSCKLIVTVNADFIVRANEGDRRLAEIINAHTSTFDGTWPYRLAQYKNPDLKFEKLSGSDLIFDLTALCAAEGRKLLIVGGTPESARGAEQALNLKYGKPMCVAWSPPFERYPFSEPFVARFRELIVGERPLAVAFCLGSPAQEFFADDQLDWMSAHGVAYAIGAGGTVDFLSGNLKRAPRWVQWIGLEGLWRLTAQPSLFRLKRLGRSVRMFRYL